MYMLWFQLEDPEHTSVHLLFYFHTYVPLTFVSLKTLKAENINDGFFTAKKLKGQECKHQLNIRPVLPVSDAP